MAQKRDSKDADATKASAQEPAPASPPIRSSSPDDANTFDSVLANSGILQHARARAHALIAESRALRQQALALGVRFTLPSSVAEGVSELSDMGKFLREFGDFLSALEAHSRVSRSNRGVDELMTSTLSLFKEIDMLLDSILASEPDGALSAGPPASQPPPSED